MTTDEAIHYEPYGRSRGERKELRQQVRRMMGTTREDPPSTRTVLQAVRAMDRLLSLSTCGRLRLRLYEGEQQVSLKDAMAAASRDPRA